mmetsp:Transcript_25597/g.64221  ORF Transcript_25597/g.64221 Transcript_25597/m.64221 type:complete len:416 (+) Transcript_25597:4187-5434(+)
MGIRCFQKGNRNRVILRRKKVLLVSEEKKERRETLSCHLCLHWGSRWSAREGKTTKEKGATEREQGWHSNEKRVSPNAFDKTRSSKGLRCEEAEGRETHEASGCGQTSAPPAVVPKKKDGECSRLSLCSREKRASATANSGIVAKGHPKFSAGPLSSMWAKKETLKWQPGVRPNPLPGRLGLVPAKSSRERHGGEKLRLGSLGLECLLTRIMPPLAWDRWSGPGSNLEVRCAAAHRWMLDCSSGRFDIAFEARGPMQGGVGARRPTAVVDVRWGMGRRRAGTLQSACSQKGTGACVGIASLFLGFFVFLVLRSSFFVLFFFPEVGGRGVLTEAWIPSPSLSFLFCLGSFAPSRFSRSVPVPFAFLSLFPLFYVDTGSSRFYPLVLFFCVLGKTKQPRKVIEYTKYVKELRPTLSQ